MLKRKLIDSDRKDFLAKFLQHIYGKTVKMHFVELLIGDVGWTIYFFYFGENDTQISKH